MPSTPKIPPPPRPNRTFSGINISSSRSSTSSTLTTTSAFHTPHPQPTGPIIAESLASVCAIADQPPLEFIPPPPKSSGGGGDGGMGGSGSGGGGGRTLPALVLYIVRVPGSMDLFLTTMHPLKKTVTGEDVLGCLYYVHVHQGGTNHGGAIDQSQQPQSHYQNQIQSQSQAQTLSPPLSKAKRWSLAAKDIAKGSGGGGGGKKIHHISAGGNSGNGAGGGASPTEFTLTIIRRDPASGEQWNVAEVLSGVGVEAVINGLGLPRPGRSVAGVARGRNPPGVLVELLGEGYRPFGPAMRPPPVPLHGGGGQVRYGGGGGAMGGGNGVGLGDDFPMPPMPPMGRNITPEDEERYFREKKRYNEMLALREKSGGGGRDGGASGGPELSNIGATFSEPERGVFREIYYDEAREGERWWKRGMGKIKSGGSGGSGSALEGGGEGGKAPKSDFWKGFTFEGLWVGGGNPGEMGYPGGGQLPPPPPGTARQGKCRFKEVAGGKILKCKYYPVQPQQQQQQQRQQQYHHQQQQLQPYNPHQQQSYFDSEVEDSYLVSALEFKFPGTGFTSNPNPNPHPTSNSTTTPSSSSSKHHHRHRLGLHRRGDSDFDGAAGVGDASGEGVGSASGGGGGRAKMGTFVVHNVGMEMLDLVVAANVAMFWRKWEGWMRDRGGMGVL